MPDLSYMSHVIDVCPGVCPRPPSSLAQATDAQYWEFVGRVAIELQLREQSLDTEKGADGQDVWHVNPPNCVSLAGGHPDPLRNYATRLYLLCIGVDFGSLEAREHYEKFGLSRGPVYYGDRGSETDYWPTDHTAKESPNAN